MQSCDCYGQIEHVKLKKVLYIIEVEASMLQNGKKKTLNDKFLTSKDNNFLTTMEFLLFFYRFAGTGDVILKIVTGRDTD